MLASLKSENETLHADHEDLISKFRSSENGLIEVIFLSLFLVEWLHRYNNLNEELRTQQMFQVQAENTHEILESESYLRENAQKAWVC